MITQYDIADRLSISQKTVSRCLSDPESVCLETREKVLELMRQMDYQPNHLSKRLKARHLEMLAICLPSIRRSHFPKIVEGIEAVGREHDWQVMISSYENDAALEARQLDTARRLRVGGLLLDPDEKNLPLYRKIIQSGTAVVTIDRRQDTLGHHFVGTDDVRGGRDAVEHLIGLGHRRIALLHSPARSSTTLDRRRGYEQAMQAAGLAIDPAWILAGGSKVGIGRAAFRRLWQMPAPTRPTAVFCDHDAAAAGLIVEAIAAGVRVPQELSVVGYAGLEWAELLPVPLTTIEQPAREIGRRAATLIFECIKDPNRPIQQIALPATLAVRSSTASVPA